VKRTLTKSSTSIPPPIPLTPLPNRTPTTNGGFSFSKNSGNILKSILTYFQILVNFLVTSRRPLTPILPFYKYFTEERGNGGGVFDLIRGDYQSIKVIVLFLTPSFSIPKLRDGDSQFVWQSINSNFTVYP
jgi:hypothetical protein